MKTRKFILALVLVAIAFVSHAQNYRSGYNSYSSPTTTSTIRYQSGYQRTDGTIVQAHYKTESNSTNLDNFSTKGNTNTYTGESGSRARDYSTGASNYGSGQTIQTGSKGGQYYINSNGNKTYVPKR